MTHRVFLGAAWAIMLAVTTAPARAGSVTDPLPSDVKVMTRNLYVGADVFRILEAESPEEIPVKVTEILSIVKASNPPERLETIADEIAEREPHLVGLQEVYTIRTQYPGDYLEGNPTPAEDVLFDYLELLLDALGRRGLDYRVASLLEDADVELPGIAGFDSEGAPEFFDARVTDHDVILARGDVATAHARSRHYVFNASVSIGDEKVTFLRGFTSVDAWIHGRKFRFVDTHLEVGTGPALIFQALQAWELTLSLRFVRDPVILVGDFNSGPDDPMVGRILPAYQQLAMAGYVDAWVAKEGVPEAGYTCCHNEFLDNPEPTLDQRIDLVWLRDAITRRESSDFGSIWAVVVGDEVEDKTPSGLWPSDHAGLIARIRLQCETQ